MCFLGTGDFSALSEELGPFDLKVFASAVPSTQDVLSKYSHSQHSLIEHCILSCGKLLSDVHDIL